MDKNKYLISKISYGNPDQSRIIHACLKKWLTDPKFLNFVSPSMNFPFNYNQWLKLYKAMEKNNIKNESYVIKKENLIIGHFSFCINKLNKETNIFHLIIDQELKQNNIAQKMIIFAENCAIMHQTSRISFLVNKKDLLIRDQIKNLGYKSKHPNKKILNYRKIIT